MTSGCVGGTQNRTANDVDCEFKVCFSQATGRDAVQEIEIETEIHHENKIEGDLEAPVFFEFFLCLFADVLIIKRQKTV